MTKKEDKVSYYVYHQNNSGGGFEKPAINVVVKASNFKEANAIFETIENCYFDGCRRKMDCSCCGDRWSDKYGESDYNIFKTLKEAKKIVEVFANGGFGWKKYGKIPILAVYCNGKLTFPKIPKQPHKPHKSHTTSTNKKRSKQ